MRRPAEATARNGGPRYLGEELGHEALKWYRAAAKSHANGEGVRLRIRSTVLLG